MEAALQSMHSLWKEAGLDDADAWQQVYREAKGWYLRTMLGCFGVVLVGAGLSRLGLGSWFNMFFSSAGAVALLVGMRLMKWHKETSS
jgi:uncharacterized membrane protein YeaQ/YmgE (transglycosylase-associated protein family)